MSTHKVLLAILIVMGNKSYATESPPTLQELITEKIINNEESLELEYVPDYLDKLGLPIDQLADKTQQTLANAIINRFKEQLIDKYVTTLSGHTSLINKVAISPDNNYIVTCARERVAKVWNSKTGQLIHNRTGHTSIIPSIAISPNNNYIVTGSWDNTAKV